MGVLFVCDLRPGMSIQQSWNFLGFSMSKAAYEEEPEVIVKRKPGGFICRLEPNNIDSIKQFPRFSKLMQKSGWFNFCEKLQGYHS